MNETPKVPGNNTLPQGTTPKMGVNPTGGTPSKSQAISQGVDMLDKATDKLTGEENSPKLGEQVIDPNEPNVDMEGNDLGGPKVGDKVAPGYEIGEDGKVKQSATSKLQGAVARGAAAYFSGGNVEAMDAAGKVSDSKIGRKVSDTLEKNKAVEKAAEELEDVADAVNDTADLVAKAKSGDVAGAVESAKKAKKSLKKGSKKARKIIIKRAILLAIPIVFPMLVGFLSLSIIAAAFADENGTSTEEVYMNSYEYDWPGEDNEGESSGIGGEDGDGSGDNGNGEISGDVILLNIPYYNQNSYKGTKFGGGTISTSGCSVTSLAMVIQYLKGGTLTPPDIVAKIVEQKGRYNYYYSGKSGQKWTIMTEVPAFYGVSAESIGLASVKQALANGKPVIASMSCCTFTRHGHFIVIKGYDPATGKYYVNDPNHPEFSSTAFSENVFATEAKAFWAFK